MTLDPSKLPFPYPEPGSLTASEARKWYLDCVRRIPEVVSLDQGPEDMLLEAWPIKARLRLAAAVALIDMELADEFLTLMPLPSIDALLEKAGAPDAEDAARKACVELLTITEAEKRAFPATVGEAIGMEVFDGQRWQTMTEAGWAPRDDRGVPKGFPVRTPEGVRPIDEIRVGDLVLSAPPSGDGPAQPKRVLRTFVRENQTLRALSTENEGGPGFNFVAACEDTEFWSEERGWTRLEALRREEPLRTDAGRSLVFAQNPVFRGGTEGVGWVQSQRDWRGSAGSLFDFANYKHIPQAELGYLPREIADSRERYLRVTVYDLDVEDFHTYFVKGHWVRSPPTDTSPSSASR
jgi:hypothetical protein